MKYAFQMDPLSGINFATDSTWQLMKEAALRGEVYYYTPQDLFWQNGELFAKTQKVTIHDNKYILEEARLTVLNEMDVIFIRQDPPYDMNYLTYTYLLEKISDQVLILNDPKAIRDFPEKISVLDYPDLTPPTLITSSVMQAKEFAQNYDQVVIKPLYSYAGNDVICAKANDLNFSETIDRLLAIYQAPFIVQKFIPEVDLGDKRIILLDGEVIGGYVRLPEKGDFRANIAQGGTSAPTKLLERDQEICDIIAPMLTKNNLFLVGIDVINGYLTEINITSPTGLVAIAQFSGQDITKTIFNKLENKKLTKSYKEN